MLDQVQLTFMAFLTEHWPVLLTGLGVGGLAFVLGRTLVRAKATNDPKPLDLEALDDLDIHSARDRRANSRRQGNEVEVQLYDPEGTVEPRSAWVVDRSLGGLCLMADVEVPVGIILNVRPRTNQPTISVPVEVRSCRRGKDGWKVGCQFQQTPPWNVLMLFG